MNEALGPSHENQEAANKGVDRELAAAQAAATERSAKPLLDRVERGGLGHDGNEAMKARARQIIATIEDNPERVLADVSKPPQDRTEYDKEKAHLTAIATNEDMTAIARDEAKRKSRGNEDKPLSLQRQKHELSRSLTEDLADKIYKDDPAAGPNLIEYHKEGHPDITKRPSLWKRLFRR